MVRKRQLPCVSVTLGLFFADLEVGDIQPKRHAEVHFIASLFDQFVDLLIFPFCNKCFNRFRDSGLPNVTERQKRNLFLFIYLIISKNSLIVLKYVSVI